MNQILSIFSVKAARVFVFGMVSIMTPVYLSMLGFSPFYIGLSLAAVVSGNIVSNILLTWFSSKLGIKPIILFFSLMMFVSGLLFFFEDNYSALLTALFVGNVSVTGTEAGPFQSVETAVIPNYVGESRSGRAYGAYNVIGYVSSSIGALASSLPSYFSDSLLVFRILYMVYGSIGLIMLIIYSRIDLERNLQKEDKNVVFSKAKNRVTKDKDIAKLSILYFGDALGGGFVTQSLLSYWFYLVYHASLSALGLIFLIANIISAASTLLAPLIAERIGNLRTMVYTHLLSNSFLICMPIAGSLSLSISFLFLRQSLSQMDVPTRQAFMVQLFEREKRIAANAVTNTSRSIANLFGGPLTGYLLSMSLATIPIITGGMIKIIYDLAIFAAYKDRVK